MKYVPKVATVEAFRLGYDKEPKWYTEYLKEHVPIWLYDGPNNYKGYYIVKDNYGVHQSRPDAFEALYAPVESEEDLSFKATIEEAIFMYGVEHQLDICVEELSELTKEIIKHKRGADNRKQIIEEMADVTLMLSQLSIIFDIDEAEFLNDFEYKLNRLSELMNKERDGND